MMSHVVDKYRKVISNSKAESHHHNGSSNGNGKKGNIDRTLTQPKTLAGYSQLNGF